jgi:predicted phage tail component-like protein
MQFNGERRGYLRVLYNLKRPAWAPVKRNILTVPGLAGGYLQSTETDIRTIEVPVRIQADNMTHLQRIKEDLAAWLVTDEPKELVFDDDPSRTYYAVVDESVDFEELVAIGKGTIKFICPDPYVYGPEQTIEIPVTEDGQSVIAQNNGSAPVFPKFVVTVNQPITFLDIISPDDYMRLGWPIKVDETPVEREERLFWSQCDNLTGWTAGEGIDGTVSGTMTTDGYSFKASNYGTGTGWHGPAMKTSIPGGPLTDFKMEAMVSLWSGVSDVGRVEIYLLDDTNRVVAKIGVKDVNQGAELVYGEARLGDSIINYHMIDEYGGKPGVWNDFVGILRLQRIGNVWEAYIAKYNPSQGNTAHTARRFVRFVDVDNVFNRNIAQIMVHCGKYGTVAASVSSIQDLKIYRINNVQSQQVPYIAQAGDVIEIDHAKNAIFKNGEPFLSAKDFSANFFALEPGQTEIAINPAGVATVQMTFRERWK